MTQKNNLTVPTSRNLKSIQPVRLRTPVTKTLVAWLNFFSEENGLPYISKLRGAKHLWDFYRGNGGNLFLLEREVV